MSKYIFLIDGFNIFHKIKRKKHPDGRNLKWCNYSELLKQFIRPNSTIDSIYYFSAFANNKTKRGKHRRYIELLEKEGVEVVLGQYKEVTKTSFAECSNQDCFSSGKHCRKKYKTQEEKQTDVNIGAYLIDLCYQKNAVDTLVLLSADSDYLAALTLAQSRFPNKKFGVILPPDYPPKTKLTNQADFSRNIKVKHLEAAVYPKEEISYIQTTQPRSDNN